MKHNFLYTFAALPAARLGLAAMLCSGLLLTACGSSGTDRAYETTKAGYSADYAPESAVEEYAAEAALPEAAYSVDNSAKSEGAGGSPQNPAAPAQGVIPANTARKLIKTVSISMESTDFDALLHGITAQVTALNGYIESSWVDGQAASSEAEYRSPRNASITARIPSAQLDSFITEVSSKGNITFRSEQVQDVTLDYTDIESHKKSLIAERERLWELMGEAESVDAVIAIQTRIGEIEYELNSYESQLRLYDNQVDYATITMEIREVRIYSAATKDGIATRIRREFSSSLENVRVFFEDLLIGFLGNLPELVLLVVSAGIIFLVLRAVFRALQKRIFKNIPGSAKKTAVADTDNKDKSI